MQAHRPTCCPSASWPPIGWGKTEPISWWPRLNFARIKNVNFKGRFLRSGQARILASVVTAGVVLGGVGAGLWRNSAASRASATYQQKHRVLSAELAAASQQGYTQQDLEPVMSRYNTLNSSGAPGWFPSQAFYFQSLTKQTTQLRGELQALEQKTLNAARTDASKRIDAAKAEATNESR